MTPVLATEDELHCRSEYLPLPEDLDANGVTAQIDWSEAFFLPTFAYTSHEIAFTAREGQEVLRVFLAKSNSKVSIIKKGDRAVVAASRAVDGGSAQLVIATDLSAGTNYVIVLEFSERHGGLDGQQARSCDHFVMAIKTAHSDVLKAADSVRGDDDKTMVVETDGEFREAIVAMPKKTAGTMLNIPGTGVVDL